MSMNKWLLKAICLIIALILSISNTLSLAYSATSISDIRPLVAILVNEKLYQEPELKSKIMNYGAWISYRIPWSMTVVYQVRDNEDQYSIYKRLKKLYNEWEIKDDIEWRLDGVILVWDIAFPQVQLAKNMIMSESIFPYTDFIDEYFQYNPNIKGFLAVWSKPVAEVWHWLIKFADITSYYFYFDKVNNYYSWKVKDSWKVLHVDFDAENSALNKQIYSQYTNKWKYEKQIAYGQFTPELYSELQSQQASSLSYIDKSIFKANIQDDYEAVKLIGKLLPDFSDIFRWYIDKVNNLYFEAWWNAWAVLTISDLVTIKDDLARRYLRAINTVLEHKVRSFVENKWQKNIDIPSKFNSTEDCVWNNRSYSTYELCNYSPLISTRSVSSVIMHDHPRPEDIWGQTIPVDLQHKISFKGVKWPQIIDFPDVFWKYDIDTYLSSYFDNLKNLAIQDSVLDIDDKMFEDVLVASTKDFNRYSSWMRMDIESKKKTALVDLAFSSKPDTYYNEISKPFVFGYIKSESRIPSKFEYNAFQEQFKKDIPSTNYQPLIDSKCNMQNVQSFQDYSKAFNCLNQSAVNPQYLECVWNVWSNNAESKQAIDSEWEAKFEVYPSQVYTVPKRTETIYLGVTNKTSFIDELTVTGSNIEILERDINSSKEGMQLAFLGDKIPIHIKSLEVGNSSIKVLKNSEVIASIDLITLSKIYLKANEKSSRVSASFNTLDFEVETVDEQGYHVDYNGIVFLKPNKQTSLLEYEVMFLKDGRWLNRMGTKELKDGFLITSDYFISRKVTVDFPTTSSTNDVKNGKVFIDSSEMSASRMMSAYLLGGNYANSWWIAYKMLEWDTLVVATKFGIQQKVEDLKLSKDWSFNILGRNIWVWLELNSNYKFYAFSSDNARVLGSWNLWNVKEDIELKQKSLLTRKSNLGTYIYDWDKPLIAFFDDDFQLFDALINIKVTSNSGWILLNFSKKWETITNVKLKWSVTSVSKEIDIQNNTMALVSDSKTKFPEKWNEKYNDWNWFKYDEKAILKISSGQSFWESIKSEAGIFTIILWDPTFSIWQRFSSLWYDQTIWKELATINEGIKDIAVFDYNWDGSQDILIAKQNWAISLLEWRWSKDKYFLNRGDIWRFDAKILALTGLNSNWDVLVSTNDWIIHYLRNDDAKYSDLPRKVGKNIDSMVIATLNDDKYGDLLSSSSNGELMINYWTPTWIDVSSSVIYVSKNLPVSMFPEAWGNIYLPKDQIRLLRQGDGTYQVSSLVKSELNNRSSERSNVSSQQWSEAFNTLWWTTNDLLWGNDNSNQASQWGSASTQLDNLMQNNKSLNDALQKSANKAAMQICSDVPYNVADNLPWFESIPSTQISGVEEPISLLGGKVKGNPFKWTRINELWVLVPCSGEICYRSLPGGGIFREYWSNLSSWWKVHIRCDGLQTRATGDDKLPNCFILEVNMDNRDCTKDDQSYIDAREAQSRYQPSQMREPLNSTKNNIDKSIDQKWKESLLQIPNAHTINKNFTTRAFPDEQFVPSSMDDVARHLVSVESNPSTVFVTVPEFKKTLQELETSNNDPIDEAKKNRDKSQIAEMLRSDSDSLETKATNEMRLSEYDSYWSKDTWEIKRRQKISFDALKRAFDDYPMYDLVEKKQYYDIPWIDPDKVEELKASTKSELSSRQELASSMRAWPQKEALNAEIAWLNEQMSSLQSYSDFGNNYSNYMESLSDYYWWLNNALQCANQETQQFQQQNQEILDEYEKNNDNINQQLSKWQKISDTYRNYKERCEPFKANTYMSAIHFLKEFVPLPEKPFLSSTQKRPDVMFNYNVLNQQIEVPQVVINIREVIIRDWEKPNIPKIEWFPPKVPEIPTIRVPKFQNLPVPQKVEDFSSKYDSYNKQISNALEAYCLGFEKWQLPLKEYMLKSAAEQLWNRTTEKVKILKEDMHYKVKPKQYQYVEGDKMYEIKKDDIQIKESPDGKTAYLFSSPTNSLIAALLGQNDSNDSQYIIITDPKDGISKRFIRYDEIWDEPTWPKQIDWEWSIYTIRNTLYFKRAYDANEAKKSRDIYTKNFNEIFDKWEGVKDLKYSISWGQIQFTWPRRQSWGYLIAIMDKFTWFDYFYQQTFKSFEYLIHTDKDLVPKFEKVNSSVEFKDATLWTLSIPLWAWWYYFTISQVWEKWERWLASLRKLYVGSSIQTTQGANISTRMMLPMMYTSVITRWTDSDKVTWDLNTDWIYEFSGSTLKYTTWDEKEVKIIWVKIVKPNWEVKYESIPIETFAPWISIKAEGSILTWIINPPLKNYPVSLLSEMNNQAVFRGEAYYTNDEWVISTRIDQINQIKRIYDSSNNTIWYIDEVNKKLSLTPGYSLVFEPSSPKAYSNLSIYDWAKQIWAFETYLSWDIKETNQDLGQVIESGVIYVKDLDANDEFKWKQINSLVWFDGWYQISRWLENLIIISKSWEVRLANWVQFKVKEWAKSSFVFEATYFWRKFFEIYLWVNLSAQSSAQKVWILDSFFGFLASLTNVLKWDITSAIAFKDISNSIYKDEIALLYKRNIIKGYKDWAFKPENKISRAEFVKILMWASKCEDCTQPTNDQKKEFALPPFRDINMSDWFRYCISISKKLWMVTGYLEDDLFRPLKNISRWEAVAVIIRNGWIKLNKYKWEFKDVNEDHWFKDYIETAVEIWMITPREWYIYPMEEITRWEAAFLFATFVKLKDCQLFDSDNNWIKDYLEKTNWIWEGKEAVQTDESGAIISNKSDQEALPWSEWDWYQNWSWVTNIWKQESANGNWFNLWPWSASNKPWEDQNTTNDYKSSKTWQSKEPLNSSPKVPTKLKENPIYSQIPSTLVKQIINDLIGKQLIPLDSVALYTKAKEVIDNPDKQKEYDTLYQDYLNKANKRDIIANYWWLRDKFSLMSDVSTKLQGSESTYLDARSRLRSAFSDNARPEVLSKLNEVFNVLENTFPNSGQDNELELALASSLDELVNKSEDDLALVWIYPKERAVTSKTNLFRAIDCIFIESVWTPWASLFGVVTNSTKTKIFSKSKEFVRIKQ